MSGEGEIEIAFDPKRCQGYGNCIPILPDVFKLERGVKTAVLLKSRLPADALEEVQEAIRNCPVRAIKLKRAG